MLLDVQVLGSKSCVFCEEKEQLELIFLAGGEGWSPEVTGVSKQLHPSSDSGVKHL